MIGRYAPSPTGSLHLGNLRTALAAWAFARSRDGRFLLRIEDLDAPRARPGCAERQLEDLKKLGIDWDEEPLRQSNRASVYEPYCARLLAENRAYPCFCSRKDIQQALSAPHADDERPAVYPGTCAKLDPAEVQARIDAGKPYAIRLRVQDAPTTFVDGFAGKKTIDLKREVGDFVIRRADGLHAYQLVCALDDSLSGVTEVLRGDDLLDSGARQQFLLEVLGLPVPAYYHIPLLLGPGGAKLSKRDGADDLAYYLAAGLDATAVRSYLAYTLGQCALGERVTMEELSAKFQIGKVPKTAAHLDVARIQRFRP